MDTMNCRHLVVAFPRLSKRDLEWIQNLRKKYDALSFNAIDPHFTLFPPSPEFSGRNLVDAVIRNVQGFMSFTFVLRCGLLMPPINGQYAYIFLVPDEGFSSFVKLRDHLYSGSLAKSLRLDVPFIPHLTVGSTRDPARGMDVVQELNRESFRIRGTIDSLSVVVEDDDRITPVSKGSFSLINPKKAARQHGSEVRRGS